MRRKKEERKEKGNEKRTKQTNGNAINTPHKAPPRIERYIEPGIEKAWRLVRKEVSDDDQQQKGRRSTHKR